MAWKLDPFFATSCRAKIKVKMTVLHCLLLIIAVAALVQAATNNEIGSHSAIHVSRAPDNTWSLLTPAPLPWQRTWRAGLDDIPVRSDTLVSIPAHSSSDIQMFDYTLPGHFRRPRKQDYPAPRIQEVRYGQVYIDWIDKQIQRHYTKQFGQEVRITLGSEEQQYFFDGRQALLLHNIQKGLRQVSTMTDLLERPFWDPIESVRLRALLASAFDNAKASPHPPSTTYPRILRMSLMNIQDQQRTNSIYQTYPTAFDSNWNNVFPFLQNDRIDIVEYYLHTR